MYHVAGIFSQVQIFPNGKPLALAEISRFIQTFWQKLTWARLHKVYVYAGASGL